jgi:hypothetical protein
MINLIPSDLVILVMATNILGFGAKKYEKFQNKYIPIFLLMFAIIFSIWIKKSITPQSILQGILCWGTSIGFHQTYKNLAEFGTSNIDEDSENKTTINEINNENQSIIDEESDENQSIIDKVSDENEIKIDEESNTNKL